jgi:hypothetical protein
MKRWTCSSFGVPSKKTLLVVLFSLMALICPNLHAEPSLSLKGPRNVAWSDFLDVNAQLLWFEEVAYHEQLEKMRALGLKWVRSDLHWDRLEPTPAR